MSGRARRGRSIAGALALGAALLAVAAGPASAADITGTWDLPAGSVAKQTWTFTAGTGALAGEGGGGPYTWPMEGTITGDAVQIKTAYRELSYTAYFVGTVAADGATMSGTWSTGGFAAAATSTSAWIANRRGGAPAPTPGPGPSGTRNPTGTRVLCNRGPNPGDDSVCTATVGDGGATPSQPTGEVLFTAEDGGTFRFGNRCTLQPSPGSPTVASCSVTYIPPPAGGFPDVVAAYQGDGAHAPSAGRTRLVSGAVFGLADGTPITVQTCKQTVNAATGGAKKSARAAYKSQTPNPLTNPIAGPGDYLGYCAVNFGYNVKGGAIRLGQGAALTVGAFGTVLGAVGVVTDPTGIGKAAGVSLVVGAPVVTAGAVLVGEEWIKANDTAIADPPDKRFRAAVKLTARKRVVVHGGGRTGRALTRLFARQARAIALARAFRAALDKAGGAEQAKQPRYVGLQTRAAIGFARSLASELEQLTKETRALAPALAKVQGMRRAPSAGAVVDARRSALPAKLTRLLRKLGWSAADLKVLRAAAARKVDPAQVPEPPTTLAGVLADARLLDLQEQMALHLRYFTVVPEVVEASKLR